MANQFGAIAQLISIVISIFVAGIFVGQASTFLARAISRLRAIYLRKMLRKQRARPFRHLSASNSELARLPEVRASSTAWAYRIERLSFASGLSFRPSAITVFIGPNNSGKSLALRTISEAVCGRNNCGPVFSSIELSLPPTMKMFHDSYGMHLDANLSDLESINPLKKLHPFLTDHKTERSKAIDELLDASLSGDKRARLHFASVYGPLFLNASSTESRLYDTNPQKRSPSYGETSGLLIQIFEASREYELAISSVLEAAFGKQMRLDDTELEALTLRVGSGLHEITYDSRNSKAELKQYPSISSQGDGIRSYAASLIQLSARACPLQTLDEPEAFLHPTQARSLGAIIGRQGTDHSQIYVATHSSSLLRGILSTASPESLRIIRLTYSDSISDARDISPDVLSTMLTNASISATTFMDGLFYSAVLILEGPSDRVFFEALRERLGLSDAIHTSNANGKGSALQMLEAYRTLAIPSAAFFDIDLLQIESDFVTALGMVSRSRTFDKILSEHRNAILANLPKGEWEEVKRHGRTALPNKSAQHFDELVLRFAEAGLFINTSGELESLLSAHNLNYSQDKRDWLENALKWINNATLLETSVPGQILVKMLDYLEKT